MKRIVYMGTPDFAVPALNLLCSMEKELDIEVGIVVSQPDRGRDRGKKVKPTAVKECALSFGKKVLQPEKIRGNREFLKEIKEYNPDLIVVAAYGKMIPNEILELPRFGCINLHGSILPRWRGAAPIQWSILSGDEEAGVSLMYISEKMDEGDVLAVKTTITAGKTGGQLFDEISQMGGELLMEKLDEIFQGGKDRKAQDHRRATYAGMLSKEDGNIDFNKSVFEIDCFVRGMNPWPCAYTYFENNIFKVWETKAVTMEDLKSKNMDLQNVDTGTVIYTGKDGIYVKVLDGAVAFTKVQVPGKKAMSVDDFLRGREVPVGTIFKREKE